MEYFLPGDGEGAPTPAAARSGKLGAAPAYDAEAKVRALWVWDLSQDLSAVAAGEEGANGRKRWAGASIYKACMGLVVCVRQ